MGFLSNLFKFALPFIGWGLFGPAGFLIGGIASSLLFPNKQPSGAPPQSIKVQTSTYGVSIPIVYGQYRLAGNIIWSTDIRPVVLPGVKSGILFFKSKSPDITYYRASWAVAFCEGPASDVTRIWFDGAEVYDVRENTDATWRARSLAKIGRSWDGIKIYLGTENEENDPEISSDSGIEEGTLSPNRGLVKIVFTNWNLSNLGNAIPNVTAEIVTQSTRIFSEWKDVSSELSIYNDARLNGTSCVAIDSAGKEHLIIAGGYIFDRNRQLVGATNYALKGTMNPDGTMSWSSFGGGLRHPVAECVMVFCNFTIRDITRSAEIWVFGGYSTIQNEGYGQTFYDPPNPDTKISSMQQMLDFRDTDGIFQPMPLQGTAGGYTQGRYPFPRDSFAAAWHMDMNANYMHGVWLYGGRNTCSDFKWGYEGPGNFYRDLWFFNGSFWELYTEIFDWYDHLGNKYTESVDGGAGYRISHSMLSYNGELFLAGGFTAPDIPMRDVYTLRYFQPSDTLPAYARFIKICSDVMSNFSICEEVANYYVAGMIGWRGKLIALLSRNMNGNEDFSLYESENNGKTWELCNKGKYPIYGRGNGTYFIEGNYTELITEGDRISAAGNYSDPHLNEYTVASVTFQSGLTILNLEGVSSPPSPSVGMIYVHQAKGFPCSVTEYMGKSFTFDNVNETIYLTGGYSLPFPPEPQNPAMMIQKLENETATGSSITLAEIVQDICVRAGMSKGLIDVSDLRNRLVKGFCVYNRVSVREILEQLQQFGFFDCVESNGKIKFVARGKPPVVHIPEEDLSAHLPDQAMPNALEYEKIQDLELPQQVDVIYPDIDSEYNDNTQTAQRQVTYSNKITTVNTPIVMDKDEAARMAYMLLYDAWNCRDTMSIMVSGYKYLYLDPADVISFSVQGSTYTGRITRIDYETTGIAKIQVVLENLDMYVESENIEGSSGGPIEPNPIHLKPLTTDYFLLDIPLLSDYLYGMEDHFGFYFAAANHDPEDDHDWQGAHLYWYDDRNPENISHTNLGSVNQAVTHGKCDTVLGDIPSTLTWDYKNTLDVTLSHGIVQSTTEEFVRNALSNLAAIGSYSTGWELIQFLNVENIGNNQYRLSGMLRGCFGTEWRVGSHETDEIFVLLERDKFTDIQLNALGMNVELKYKVVPFGRGYDEVEPFSFTCTSVRKKPYSVSHLQAFKQENGDWRIIWKRRARGLTSYFAGLMVPITDGRNYGQYEIEFLDEAGNVLHIQSIDVISINEDLQSPYFLFTVDGYYVYQGGKRIYQVGQKDAYGDETNIIHITIYQVSETVGRGYGVTKTFVA